MPASTTDTINQVINKISKIGLNDSTKNSKISKKIVKKKKIPVSITHHAMDANEKLRQYIMASQKFDATATGIIIDEVFQVTENMLSLFDAIWYAYYMNFTPYNPKLEDYIFTKQNDLVCLVNRASPPQSASALLLGCCEMIKNMIQRNKTEYISYEVKELTDYADAPGASLTSIFPTPPPKWVKSVMDKSRIYATATNQDHLQDHKEPQDQRQDQRQDQQQDQQQDQHQYTEEYYNYIGFLRSIRAFKMKNIAVYIMREWRKPEGTKSVVRMYRLLIAYLGHFWGFLEDPDKSTQQIMTLFLNIPYNNKGHILLATVCHVLCNPELIDENYELLDLTMIEKKKILALLNMGYEEDDEGDE